MTHRGDPYTLDSNFLSFGAYSLPVILQPGGVLTAGDS